MSVRNSIVSHGFVLEKLTDRSAITQFDCGNEDLNEYFKYDSAAYLSELMTQTYCFYREGQSQKDFVALVDFCNDSISRDFVPKKERKNIAFPKRNYKSFPALKITRLGVDIAFQKQHVGSCLLDTIKELFVTDNRSGCRFLTLDAYVEAEEFYKRNGFISVQVDSDSKTIPMFFDLFRVKRN